MDIASSRAFLSGSGIYLLKLIGNLYTAGHVVLPACTDTQVGLFFDDKTVAAEGNAP